MTRTYSRDDVQFHSDLGGSHRPAVNVKVYRSIWDSAVWDSFRSDEGPDEGFTPEWIEDNVSEETLDAAFWHVCEGELEYLEGWATGSDGAQDAIFPEHKISIEQEGRSGGWLAVDGLPDLEEWDAVLLGRWRRFERIARDIADGVPVQVLSTLYINEWTWAKDEAEESARAARQDIATALPDTRVRL